MSDKLDVGGIEASMLLNNEELHRKAEDAEKVLESLDQKEVKPKVTADTSNIIEKTEEAAKAIDDVGERAKNTKVSLPEPQTKNTEAAFEGLNILFIKLIKQLESLQTEYHKTQSAEGEQSQKVKALEAQIQALNAALEKHKKELQDILDASRQNSDGLDDTRKSADGADDAIKNLNRDTKKLSDGFTVAKGAAADLVSKGFQLIADKAVEIGRDIIQTGEQFTAAMSEVGAISGATGDELEKLEETARHYGATTQFSATEAAQALKYMALAGWDVQTSISALPGVLDLAAASGMNLAQASDMVTDYLSAFGMAADKAAYMADLMTYAQSNSNTSAEQLGQAWGNCAANLSAAGQDVETVTSMLEGMANQGLKGSQAGTALSAVMRDINSKMKDGAISIGETSISVQDANGNFRDLTDIMADVEKATNGMGSAQKTAALSGVFTEESIKGVNIVLKEGVKSISDYEDALRNSSGTAAEAAAQMNDNLTGDMKNMNSALEELKLKIFENAESPLRDLVQAVTNDGVPALEALLNNMDKIVPVVTAAGTAFVSYKAAIGVESIIKGVISATTALAAAKAGETIETEKATAAQTMLNGVQAANPIGLLVAAIGLLVGGLTTYWTITGQASDATDQYTKSLSRAEKAIDDCNKQLQSAEDKYSSSIANAEANAAQIRALGDEYEKLRSKQNKTSDEMVILDSIAEELAKSMGKTTDDLKNQNGQYIELNNTIDEYIKKLKEKVQIEAAAELYGDAVKARVKAEQELNNFKRENLDLETRREEIEKKRAVKALGATGITYDDEQDINALEAYDRKVNELSQTVSKAIEVENNYSKAIDDAANSQEKASDSSDVFSRSIEKFKKDQEEANKLLEKKTKTTKTAAAEQKAFNKDSKDLQSIFNSEANALKALSDQYNGVADGQMMSFDALLQLSLQYPQYSSKILAANGNLETQKKVLNELFEAKKNDLKATVEKMKAMEAERDYLSNYIHSLEVLKNNGVSVVSVYPQVTARLKQLRERFKEINDEIGNTPGIVAAFENAFNSLANIDINNYGYTHGGNYVPSQTYSDPINTGYTWWWMGEEASGATSAEARTNLVERVAELGKITQRELRAEYQKILQEEQLTADEIYNIRVKLLSLTDRLRQSDFDSLLKRIDDGKSLGQESLQSEIQQYKNMLRVRQMTADQCLTIQKRLYDAQNQLRQEQTNALTKLGNAIVTALQNKYKQQRQAEEQLIEESIQSWENWEKKTVDAIQGQIDALDDLQKAHDQENQREEYENKRKSLERQLKYEKDDYNRIQLQKEIAALDKNEGERLFTLEIADKKSDLQKEMDAARQYAEDNRKKLTSEKNKMIAAYDELLTDQALKAEAQNKILHSTQDQLIEFINQYAADYEMLGTTLGDSLYKGLSDSVSNITDYVNHIAARTDTQNKKTEAAEKLDEYIRNTDKRIITIDSINRLMNSFAVSLDSISGYAAQYRNQLAAAANDAADKYYYKTQNVSNQNMSVSKPVNVTATINFNDKVDSPIEVKRQIEYVGQQLAKDLTGI